MWGHFTGSGMAIRGRHRAPKLLKKAIIDPFVAISHPACLKLVDQCGSRLDQGGAHPGRWFDTICSCRNCHLGVLQRSKVAKIGHKWGVTLKNQILPLFGPKIGPGAPQEPTLQHGQHKKIVILMSRHDGNKKIWRMSPKNGFLSKKQHFLASKRALLGNQGPKTAFQAATWAPTGKPKVSKVASGYAEVMIPSLS